MLGNYFLGLTVSLRAITDVSMECKKLSATCLLQGSIGPNEDLSERKPPRSTFSTKVTRHECETSEPPPRYWGCRGAKVKPAASTCTVTIEVRLE